MLSRRAALKHLALTAGVLAVAPSAPPRAQAQEPGEGVFKLPPLGYDYDALEPHLDAETMKLHHGKHHAAYVARLNQAVARTPGIEKTPIEQLLANLHAVPEAAREEIRNQGGGHANHSLLWQTLRKGENAPPAGALAQAIDATFGGFEKFQEAWTAAALRVFGSGWAWLAWRDGKLAIETTENQDTPLMTGGTPLAGIDVWEHAYYLRYQNRRADYVRAFQSVVAWEVVAERFGKVAGR